MRRVGKLEGLQTVASLLDPPDPLERLKVDLESASRIDLRSAALRGRRDRTSCAPLRTARGPLGIPDHYLYGPANAANVFAAVKFLDSRQLTRFGVGVLANRKSKLGSNAIVTDRLGRSSDDKVPHVI
jgi:hypothetical protein